MKLLQSGKINIDGAIELTEVKKLYSWINRVLIVNYNEVIKDHMSIPEDSDSSDTDISEHDFQYEDIYEDIYENNDSDHDDSKYEYICTSMKETVVGERITDKIIN